jgi:predicted metalloprotease with PDZ domain
LPTSPPRIEIVVGERSIESDYERNWSLTHEMVHLAFPNVPNAHHWLEEGLATYVEPIARARSGWISEESVWREWIENMPLGLPTPNDAGLDGTDSWGRTYWGGALYCLLADIEIQKRSAGRHGLAEALRAIVAAGGSVSQRWPLERALHIGDQATGTTALADTYAAMKDHPLQPDLAGLWRQLGVRLDAGQIHYDDGAALASVRRAIVAGRRAR